MVKPYFCILWIVYENPLLVDIVHHIRDVQVSSDEVGQLLLSPIAGSVVLVKVCRTIGIHRDFLLLKLLFGYPCSPSILVNDLYLVTCIVGPEGPSEEERHSGYCIYRLTL